ncbi:MAG: 16S rRNA (guanine(966)-N(2))-methyltransferase RsmD [Gammaproteobacteria bacterium]|nr:16S rRNA (guanine(966)-N(2))-methyltransferase RsmD [Gammaproteobacteria bacterium]
MPPRPGELRIIGGEWRSRKLPIADVPGLRPSTDRVRETLFNWLQADIAGARCLDLFAGSGALGFEAASRGAREVVLVESDVRAQANLASNIVLLQARQVQLVRSDAMNWLQQATGSFDVVFIDPPYASQLLAPSCTLLEQRHLLAPQAKIYLEYPAQYELPQLPVNWQIIRGKKAGQVGYYLALRDDRG